MFKLLFVSFITTHLLQGAHAGNCTSDDSNYDFALTPLSGLSFYWKIDSGNLNVKLVYSDEAWVAMGASDDGYMIGSEAIMGLPDDNTVYKYDITAKTTAGIEEMSSAKQTLTGTSVSASSGTTQVEFVKIMEETGEIAYSSTESTILIFAVGTSTSLAYHDAQTSLSVNLATCESSVVKIDGLSTFGVFMHGFLLIGAWLWLVPSGILVAKFKGVFGPAWVQLHMPIQVMAVLTMICGVLVMTTSLNTVKADHMNSAETDFGVHTRLGMIVLLIAVLQVIMGAIRPHKPAANEPKPVLRLIFEFVHILLGHASVVIAILAVLSGIDHAHSFDYIDHREPFWVAAFFPICIYYMLLLAQVIGLIQADTIVNLGIPMPFIPEKREQSNREKL